MSVGCFVSMFLGRELDETKVKTAMLGYVCDSSWSSHYRACYNKRIIRQQY